MSALRPAALVTIVMVKPNIRFNGGLVEARDLFRLTNNELLLSPCEK